METIAESPRQGGDVGVCSKNEHSSRPSKMGEVSWVEMVICGLTSSGGRGMVKGKCYKELRVPNLVDMLGLGKLQQGDVAGNWLSTATFPWRALKAGVAGSGSPAESLFNALGVEMPPAEKPSIDQQMLDIMTATVAPLKMPKGFYSALDRAVATGNFNKQQFGDYPKAGSLYKAAKRIGIHPDELKAIEPLKGSQERVPKAEVLGMVKEGVPQLEKRVLGDPDDPLLAEWRRRKEAGESREGLPRRKDFEPRHEIHSLEGPRENYRENLWYYDPKNKIPVKSTYNISTPEQFNDFVRSLPDDEYISDWPALLRKGFKGIKSYGELPPYIVNHLNKHPEELTRLNKVLNENAIPEIPRYQEPLAHYPGEQGKNLMMWSRTDDRQLVSGEKVSYLDEVQSGWHARGSKEGYSKPTLTNLNITYEPAATEQGRGVWLVHDNAGTTVRDFPTEDDARRYVAERGRINPKGVPDAPLKTDWYKPAMRDLVADAVRKGHNGVAWSTKDIQMRRWPRSDPIKRLKQERFFKRIYDEAIPKFMKNEYGVEPVRKKVLPTVDIWYLPLTPAVRKRIELEGQRLSKREESEPRKVMAA